MTQIAVLGPKNLSQGHQFLRVTEAFENLTATLVGMDDFLCIENHIEAVNLGEKLRELLRTHNTMEAVNLTFEKEHITENAEKADGGWHTEGSLSKLPGWTEC